MRIPFFVRLQALFARDKDAFWWNHFTDDERKLREMDVKQLAAALHEAQVRGDNERRIVVEHMLSVRLARIQASASWGSGVLGFIGAVLGAALTVALTSALAPSSHSKTTVKCECGAQSPPASMSSVPTAGSVAPSANTGASSAVSPKIK